MPKRNAFWYFMRELMDEMRNEGIEVNSFHEMPHHAGPKWTALSAEQRRPYEEMVSSSDSPPPFNDARPVGRMNNHRELIADRAREDYEKEFRKTAREKEVVALRRFWPPGNEIIKEKFQLIHFEYFVKTPDDEHLPCEVALVEFSMEEGITRKFHSYVDPGPCPRGYMFEERLRSEQRHQIPCCERFKIPQFSDADRSAFKDHKKILKQIVDFASGAGTIANPRVFTFGDDLEMVVSCLDFLFAKSKGVVDLDKFDLPRVLPLEHLLPQFYFHSTRIVGPPPSINSMQRVLTQSVWDYESGIRCAFHEEVETRFCALGQVHRWCFAIFDAMKMPIVDEDQRKDRKIMSAARPIFDFTLTDRHLPAPTKSSFTLLNPDQLIDAEYRKSMANAVKPREAGRSASFVAASDAGSEEPTGAAASAAPVVRPRADNVPPASSDTSGISSLRHDIRDTFRRDALRFDDKEGEARVSAASTPAALSATASREEPSKSPQKVNFIGRGFGAKSCVAQVGAAAASAAAAAAAAAAAVAATGRSGVPSYMRAFGRGRGCAKRSH